MAKAATRGAGSKNLPARQGGREVAEGGSSVPEYMRGKAGAGLKGIDESDLEMPRIYLLSNVHEEVTTHDDAEPGQIWHNVMEKALADKGESLRIVPILVTKEAILWRPRGDGNGGILARCKNPSDPEAKWVPSDTEFEVKIKNVKEKQKWNTGKSLAASGLLEWGTSIKGDDESPPAGTLTYRLLVAFPDHPEIGLAVLTCQRASIRPAKKLLTSIRMSGAPSYGLIYKLGSKSEEGPEGPFMNYTFTGDGFVPEEDYAQYEKYFESFKGKDFHGKGEDAEEATVGAAAGRGTGDGKSKY